MVRISLLLLCLLVSSTCLFHTSSAQTPGFVSLDCGGAEPFTDELGLKWSPDNHLIYGETAKISSLNETRAQYTTLRHFPADSRKYCYTLNVTSRNRYLLRATFLYGDFDNSSNVYPKFDISLGATHWATIAISETYTIETAELVFLASTPTVSVCLSNATTGKPFISTLELRQLNGPMYGTDFEERFYLSVAARINFGAESEAPVRYPDDPYDRIWESDLLKKPNYLVDVAAGTARVSTTLPIESSVHEKPPQKVMQTAVVGTNGSLTYRINLEGFPGSGWAFTYFSEIEDLAEDESRKFRLVLPDQPDISKAIVNIKENALGPYRVYEPGYPNITLPYVLNFRFAKTADSSRGPLLNAMEISKYLRKSDGSVDATIMANVASLYSSTEWAQEGGDPCSPSPWSWVECNSDPQPRVVAVKLSNMNLTGNIPSDLVKLTGLVELWLDGNNFTGPIPDFSRCPNLEIIHFENNRLTGKIPSSLAKLPNLKELYLQNNFLTGTIPSDLTKDVISNFSGNLNLEKSGDEGKKLGVIIGASVGAAVLLIATIISCIFMCKSKKNNKMRKTSAELTNRPLPIQRVSSTLSEAHGDAAHCFTLYEIEEATKKFEKRIGSGGFGIVYYGKTREGKEIAVKVLANNSYQGKREFANEVTLLSRIHHRNLVQFLGYCQEEGKNMLVYEFMHNGTLKEHLYGVVPRDRRISWIKRLEIAEDAARGIEYLHTGCVPAIIHRDLKTSNILIDKHMRAKVSDFGLSKFAVDGTSHVSSIVRGTVGYLDPEYYISQQLTEKSDVYSFGVILLELMSGQEAISNESFGVNCRNIVQWAKMHIDNGDIRGIIDPALAEDDYSLQSMWKIAEKALLCVKPHGNMRPSMSEVQKDIQDAIRIEKEALAARGGVSDEFSRSSAHSSSLNMGMLDLAGSQNYVSIDESVLQPTAR
ncbi:PREDICTED: probable LRR receptor-like serine/threonine-protein kinase At1g67720 [Camelina sativa]|uniref:Probable LRR receptor-like serine/threonine-protein kinase At1g67720 n=1 Tax=Camelina sativa TaxID=90675 RepID=A0ABM0Z288_CAMSA|nr:PREDICTED: probable LRR receptor-like serine/threonine-protein kinase At1g67720 [Camelina sativa]